MDDVTAILLCGGKGERLRPLTEDVPKPLLPLQGRPLLDHLVAYLHASGIHRFVICVGHLAEHFEAFVRQRRGWDWNAICVDSGDASMTDRLLDARPHVPGRALICYGDTLANVDLHALKCAHERRKAWLTLVVYPFRSPFGVVYFDEQQRVTEFTEKPLLPYWINIGFMLCEAAALDVLQRGWDMPRFLGELAGQGRLFAYRHQGRHLTVNTPRELAQAESAMAEFYTVPSEPES